MSAAGQPSGLPAKGEKEKKRLGKVLSRAKGLLKRGESSSRRRAAPTKPIQTTEPISETSPPPRKVVPPRRFWEDFEGVTSHTRSQILEERAQRLGERFGLEIKPSEWQIAKQDDTVFRMDKPIRMRVRRTCHRCDATFTSAKECPKCSHTRCNKCVRHPSPRTEEEKVAHREKRVALIQSNKENAPIVADWQYDPSDPVTLKKPARKNGQELIHKKPRQRVRRHCHECNTLFVPGVKECAKCGHKRCTDCPRDPPKKDKYPFGYPGDEFGPSSVPHYECENCRAIYPPASEDGTECRNCGVPKSESSSRVQPRKMEPEFDPEIVNKIQERLQSLRV